MKDKLLDLFTSSAVTQGTLAVLVVGIWGYMIVSGGTIPQSLDIIVGGVIGFFFGGKFVTTVSNIQKGQ